MWEKKKKLKKKKKKRTLLKLQTFVERVSNILDPAEEGISKLKARFTEIIQNSV